MTAERDNYMARQEADHDLIRMRTPPHTTTREVVRLRAQVQRLRVALAPFAGCVDQIAETESDEEWAKFRLLVTHYRCAQRVMRETEA